MVKSSEVGKSGSGRQVLRCMLPEILTLRRAVRFLPGSDFEQG